VRHSSVGGKVCVNWQLVYQAPVDAAAADDDDAEVRVNETSGCPSV